MTENLPVIDEHRGQRRMAERMARLFAGKLIYVPGLGWHEWDGRRWSRDETGAARRAVMATADDAITEALGLDRGAKKELMDDALRLDTASAMVGTLTYAEALTAFVVEHDRLDADAYQFNTLDGTLDLRTGEIHPHTPADLITKLAPHHLDDANGEEWRRFLKEILPDDEEREYVQKVIGYAMLGKVTEHIMPIFTGTGANGKGTTRDAVKHAFGDYAIEVDPALLMESRHERHGTFKMQLRGARLVFTSETDLGRRFNEAAMKRLTGGDPIEANYMRQDPIEFDPSHTLIMLTNHLPRVSGDDPSVWRRLRVIPYDVVIPEDQQDGELPDRLRQHAGAVLAWAYEGYRKYAADGRLKAPDKVTTRTDTYRADSDEFSRFLEDRTEERGTGGTRARAVYTEWVRWNNNDAGAAGSEPEFASRMIKRGYDKSRTSAGMVYRGLHLRGCPK